MVKRDQYEKSIAIRELLERLALDCFNNTFSTDTGNLSNNIRPLDEVDEGDTVSTCCALYFYVSDSTSTEVRNISEINLNSASLLAYTLENSTIGSHHTDKKNEL